MSASKLSLELAKPRDLGAYVLQQLALPKPIHQTEAENRGGGGGQWPGSARGSYRGENLLLKELLSCLGGDPGSREAGVWGVPRCREEARAVRLCRCRPTGSRAHVEVPKCCVGWAAPTGWRVDITSDFTGALCRARVHGVHFTR